MATPKRLTVGDDDKPTSTVENELSDGGGAVVEQPGGAVSDLSAALRRRVDRVGRFFLLMAGALVLWIVFLAVKLPTRKVAVHYDIAWVGFDSGLAAALLVTGALLIRRSPHVVLPAAGTATLLLADAWFDVVTARGYALVLAIVLAVGVELPLAALALTVAVRALRRLAAARVTPLRSV